MDTHVSGTVAAPDLRPYRVAIIGTGAIAHSHVLALRETAAVGAVEIVAAVDTDLDRARAFAAQYGIPSAGTSLTDQGPLDVVHLCTPPSVHTSQAEDAFARGAHVVVEKPPALSLDEVDTMTAAAERAGRVLAVVFQQRTGSAAAHVKRLLDSGALGRPLVARCDTLWFRGPEYFAVPWRGTWASEGGGTTLGHGIHQLDLLAHLLGEVDEVSGQAWRLVNDIETEDVSTATLRFRSGVVASVLTSAVSPRETSSIRIDTTRATIELEHLYGHGHTNWRITPARDVTPEEAASWELPGVEIPSGHVPYLAGVYGALRTGAPLPDIADAPARSLEIVTALYTSSRLGRVVAIDEIRADASLRGPLSATVTDLRETAAIAR